MTKLIVTFCNFANTPKSETIPTNIKNALGRPERRWENNKNES
jgi:hypothetical protein